MGRPSKKNSKQYISSCNNLQQFKGGFEKFRKEKKLARDVAGLLSDIINNIAIQQTPSTDHPHSEHNYTLHSVGSPPTYRSVATQTYFEEIFERPKLRPKEAKINGRRIIDFQYFFNELKDVSSHSKSLCNLNNMIITKEEKSGICTSYNLKCLVCNFEKEISSESPYRDTNLNADFVSGILSIDCNFMDSYVLLAQIHLPLLNNDEFIQESKNACLTRDKITQRIYQEASRNLKKQLQIESLARKLVAMKRKICPRENIQREHQLTITTQQCSSASDNSNIQRESQLTSMKQSSSAYENIQKKFQLTTLEQNSSAHKNIQREPQLATMKQSSSAHENMQSEHLLTTTTQKSSSVSDNSNIHRESQLIAIKQSSSTYENTQRKLHLITLKQDFSAHEHIQRKSQLATMKESSSAHENVQREHELITTQQCSFTSDNSNLFEQVHLGGLSVEDEFEIKEENVTEEENEFETMITDQTKKTSNSKLIAGREQVILNTMTVKQEIDSDDENSNKSITKERTNKKSVMVFVNAEQIGAMLTEANEGRACENTMVVNEEKIHLQKNVMVDNNMLVKPEFHDVEMINKERVTDFDNKPDSESPFKKARTVTYKESNNSDTRGTPTTAPNKEITVFQNMFESNRLATSAPNNLRNGTATSSVTSVRTATVTKASGEKVTFSVPVKFNENGALIIPQNPHDKASGTFQGVNGTACMPGIPSAMQQPASIPNASGATCVPLKSTAVQPTVSSNAMPKVWDDSKTQDALGQDGRTFSLPRAEFYEKNIFLTLN